MDYLLFRLNQMGNFLYVETCGLRGPTDDATEVVEAIVKRFGKDPLTACRFFLKLYREGKLGLFMLDEINLGVYFTNRDGFTTKPIRPPYSFLRCLLEKRRFLRNLGST